MDQPTWKQLLRKAAFLLLAFALIIAGVLLGRWSFDKIHHMRQLERVPPITANALVVGPANVRGEVVADQTLSAPDSRTACVYYRYQVERKDSDDEWEVVEDYDGFTRFRLRDDTGEVAVVPSERVDFYVDEAHSRTSGDYRYTEWRIDPGDTIFVFGRAEPGTAGYELHFNRRDSYQPIISHADESVERSRMAFWSALGVFGALACLAYAIVFLLAVFGVQSSSLYLFSVTGTIIAALLWQGLAMMHRDVADADRHARGVVEATRDAITVELERADQTWSGRWDDLGATDSPALVALPAADRARVRELRLLAAATVRRTNANLDRFPERLLGPMWGYDRLEPVALPEADARLLADRQLNRRPARLVPFWGIVGLVVGGLAMIFGTRWGLRRVRTKRTIENIPTSPIAGVAYGVTEVKGRVEADAAAGLLEGPLTRADCVWYDYEIEEKDSDDDWRTVHTEERRVPFLCRDATGSLRIAPAGARVMPIHEATSRRGDRRYTERHISPGERVYAIGHAAIDRVTHDRLYLTGDLDGELPYIISTLAERDVQSREARAAFNRMNVGLLGTIFAALAGMGVAGTFGPMLYTTAAVIAVGFLFVALALLYYNDLIFLRQLVDRNWSNIDVALKKRLDLVRSLERVAHGYLAHEREVQEALARARTASAQAADDPSAGQAAFEAESKAVAELRAVVEAYPQLSADEVTGRLMDGLREVEDEIALMRSGYNAAVERYNTRIAHVPEVVLARLFGFDRAVFFGQR